MASKQWYELDEKLTGRRYAMALARKQPSAVLLALQLLIIVLMPWFDGRQHARAIFAGMSLAALTLAVWTVRSTPALTRLAFFIALPAIVLEVWSVMDPSNTAVVVIAHLMLSTFYFYTGYALVQYIFADRFVTKDELFAVGAAFTVFVFAFAYTFIAIQEMWPGSFTNYAGDLRVSFHEMLYGSVANLTSVGSTDIIPLRPHARAVVMLEQIAGVFYIAMVISRLVAMSAMRRT